jgi:hypothetical protein
VSGDSGSVFSVVFRLRDRMNCATCPLCVWDCSSSGHVCVARPDNTDPQTGENEFGGSPAWCPFKDHAAVQVTYVS